MAGEPALLLHVHTALHYTSGEAEGNPMPYTWPNAPEHWLKLLTPDSVMQVRMFSCAGSLKTSAV